MNLQPKLQKLANKINEIQGLHLQVSNEANNEQKIGFLIIVLSLVGGVVANGFLIMFLGLIGFFSNSITILITSILLIAAGYTFNRLNTAVVLQSILSTLIVSGTALFIYALHEFSIDLKFCTLILCALCVGYYFLMADFIIRFLAVLTFLGSFLYSCVLVFFYEDASDSAIIFSKFYILLVLIGVILFLKNEAAWFANKKCNLLYQPTLSGMQLFLLLTMYIKVEEGTFWTLNIFHHLILSGIFLYVLYDVLQGNLKLRPVVKIGVLLPMLLFVFSSIYQPSMLLSLLLLLIYFKYKEMIFFYVSGISLLLTIGLFYYDLSINLLYKSLLLIAGGLMFFIVYVVVNKSSIDEK